MISDNMLLLHGNNRYHAKEHEYQGTEIAAENTYRAELGLHLYGKSWQETTTGAQLFSPLKETITYNGVTINFNDSKLIVNGTAIENGSFAISKAIKMQTGEKYILTLDTPHSFENIWIRSATNINFGWLGKQGKNHVKIIVPDTITEKTDCIVCASIKKGQSYNFELNHCMLNYGDTALAWEPYTGGMPSPNPDYPQPINSIGDSGSVDVVVSDSNGNSQTLTINTPNGLCGIPVDTGGNYTDSTGQQWVCDEVDFERGVYVQRVEKITSYNNEQLSTKYMSTTGKLTTGASVIYILATPIETPLTAAEFAAYKAIKSYPHYTRIESAAELKVKLMEY